MRTAIDLQELMDRRSTPQKKIDDVAFPVRVRILVPERGFENLLRDIRNWLDAEVGRGNYADHSAITPLADATAWYFRTVEGGPDLLAQTHDIVGLVSSR